MDKHSAGPWRVVKEIQLDDDGISTVPIFGPEGPGYGRVGTAYAEIGRDDELWPNARLIALAPELLEALKATLGALEAMAPVADEFFSGIGRDLHKELPGLRSIVADAQAALQKVENE